MAATLLELRGRIRSAGSIKKITKAQELIATSRIGRAQARLEAARPYASEITSMLTTLAAEAALDHPLLVERENPKRAGVLVVTSDRGLCGDQRRGRDQAEAGADDEAGHGDRDDARAGPDEGEQRGADYHQGRSDEPGGPESQA